MLKLSDYKIFQFADKYYLLVVKSAAIFEIDLELKNLLEVKEGYIDIDNFTGDKDNLISSFKKVLLLDDEENNFKLINGEISSVVLMLSQACNLRCKYCYAGDGEYQDKGFMTKEVAKEAIDFLFRESKRERLHIVLFGGEPLLNFTLFKYCVEYAKSKAVSENKKLSFSTTTNGTLLTKEIADFLIKNKFGITISIDGDKNTHDANRVDKFGFGTYDKIVNDIDNFLDIKKLNARATISSVNTSIDEIYSHLSKLGFGSVRLSTSVNTMSEKNYQDLIKSNKKMIQDFKINLEKNNFKECMNNSNIMSILNRLLEGGVRQKFCGAGNNMIAVDKQGEIYACHRLVDVKSSSYGNVKKTYDYSAKETILNQLSDVHNNSDCSKCWALSICGGGCPAENYYINNSYNIPHKLTCDLYRTNLEDILNIYVNLTDNQKSLLFYNKKGLAC